MDVFTALLFFILGMIVASFVGVVAVRRATGESILHGRSRCDACNEPLSFFSLVPALSYMAGKGRAQCCGGRISAFAPISELVLGALFVISYMQFGFTYVLMAVLLSLAALLALVLYDLAHEILPPAFLCVFIGSALLAALLGAPSYLALGMVVGTAALLALALFALHFFSHGKAMGFADAPLVFGLSLLAGPAAFSGFIFSFWIGAVVGIVILLLRPRGARMGIEVPFAPFLASGFLFALYTSLDPFVLVSDVMMRFFGA